MQIRCLAIGIIIIWLADSSVRANEDNLRKDQVGLQKDGSVVVTTDQKISPAGAQVDTGARPNALAFSPDGQKVAFLMGQNGGTLVSVVDVKTAQVTQHFSPPNPGGAPAGILYSKDGTHLYVSETRGLIDILDVAKDGTLSLANRIALPEPDGGTAFPIGLAVSNDDQTLYVALSRHNTLGVIDLTTQQLVKEIPVGNAPWEVLLVGDKAYVSNEGGRTALPSDFTNDSSGTAIVADPESGGSTTGTVSVVDLHSEKTVKSIAVDLHPTAMTLENQYLFVANTNSDTVSVVDTAIDRVVKTISIQPFRGAPFGSTPTGLTFVGNSTLVVALGANNALGIYHWSGPMNPVELQGLVPTAWYPGAVSVDNLDRLVVANIKGIGSLGDGSAEAKAAFSQVGTASFISMPDEKQLDTYTRQVFENNGWDKLTQQKDRQFEDHDLHAIPTAIGEPSLIKHVFFIIKENRTYDQILGDLANRGNGDPNLVQFGKQITPNEHALAQIFPLFDNFYASGIASDEGHQWTDEAYCSSYLEKMEFGGPERGFPFDGGDALAYSPAGFLWENAINHGKTAQIFGEFASQFNGPQGHYGTFSDLPTWQAWYKDAQILAGTAKGKLHASVGSFQAQSDVPSDDALLFKDYPPFISIDIPDQYREEIFRLRFNQYVTEGNLPNLIIMTLPDDHTAGVTPGFLTPNAMVADNDLALGKIIDAISHSPFWRDSAIFVVEDDAQNGTDHVDGHRTVSFAVSPYARRKIVDNTYYTQIDMVRTIEQILGLSPMNQFDLAASPMRDAFTDKPDFTPYNFIPSNVPLTEITPAAQALKGIRRDWALASKKLFTRGFKPDDPRNERFLNHALWYSVKGFSTLYPGESKILRPQNIVENNR
jgi:YVTN family beta-propeller protein